MMMTAQVISIKPQTVNALIAQARAAWDRAEQKKSDADDWALRTGKLLVELKARVKDDGGKWLAVLKQLGRSQQRASELMQLARGTITIEKQRERTRIAMKKTRAKQKSLLRDGDLRATKATPEPEVYAFPSMEERLQISLENLCGDVIAREAYCDKNFPGWRSVSLPSHTKTLVREAATALASLAAAVAAR
jgi:hypothetical protein